MSTTTKETNYNIDQLKKNAATSTLVGSGAANLQDYGIDYSQAQRDEIANIFANQASAAYGKAQNDYAENMANQNATLRDTIRRSQAQAVATGASRGMQAANELSSMLGLQEEAAKGATELQSSYAEALANAQKQAMDIQNARAQAGSQMYAADAAAEAQKYSVNMDAQVNDPYRVLTEISNLRAQGNTAAADSLLTGWLASHGVSEGTINNSVTAGNTKYDETGTPITTKVNWSAGNDGTLSGDFAGSAWNKINWSDLGKSNDEQFVYSLDGKKYTLTARGTPISSSSDATLFSTLGKLSGNPTAASGVMVYYNGRAYVSANGNWHKIDTKKDEGDKFLEKLKG